MPLLLRCHALLIAAVSDGLPPDAADAFDAAFVAAMMRLLMPPLPHDAATPLPCCLMPSIFC